MSSYTVESLIVRVINSIVLESGRWEWCPATATLHQHAPESARVGRISRKFGAHANNGNGLAGAISIAPVAERASHSDLWSLLLLFDARATRRPEQ